MKNFQYWRNLIIFASSVLLIGITAVIVSYTYQAALGYPHPSRVIRSADDTPAKFGIAYQDVTFKTVDGLRLSAWYTPPKNGAVILVAHGYHGVRDLNMHVFFAKHGYGVVTWDFRAHGESEGDLSTIGYNEVRDVEAALDFALAQPNVKKVGAWGGSMGAAVSIMAAAKRNEISAVVADSAYATLEGQLDTMVKVAALRPLVRFFAEREAGMSVDMVRPVDHVARLSPRPILIIQGLADDSIPINSAQLLYDAASEPKLLWQESNAGHVGMKTVYPDQYEKKVFAFFDAAPGK